jgi:hypothetical protein
MNEFHDIDTYLMNVDATFCSQQCACNITSRIPWDNDYRYNTTINSWVVDKVNGVSRYQDCPKTLAKSVFAQTAVQDPAFDPIGDFQYDRFSDYFARIENQFQCTGWCNTRYINPATNRQVTMGRYLFSDINQ